jgi:glutamate dehydrogenase
VQAAGLLDIFSLLEVTEIALTMEYAPERVAEVYFALSERYEIDRMLTRITNLPRSDRWEALARAALRYDLYAALADLTRNVLTAGTPDAPVDTQIAAWEEANAEGLARARTTLDEITATENVDLAALSVALRAMRTLVRS